MTQEDKNAVFLTYVFSVNAEREGKMNSFVLDMVEGYIIANNLVDEFEEWAKQCQ